MKKYEYPIIIIIFVLLAVVIFVQGQRLHSAESKAAITAQNLAAATDTLGTYKARNGALINSQAAYIGTVASMRSINATLSAEMQNLTAKNAELLALLHDSVQVQVRDTGRTVYLPMQGDTERRASWAASEQGAGWQCRDSFGLVIRNRGGLLSIDSATHTLLIASSLTVTLQKDKTGGLFATSNASYPGLTFTKISCVASPSLFPAAKVTSHFWYYVTGILGFAAGLEAYHLTR